MRYTFRQRTSGNKRGERHEREGWRQAGERYDVDPHAAGEQHDDEPDGSPKPNRPVARRAARRAERNGLDEWQRPGGEQARQGHEPRDGGEAMNEWQRDEQNRHARARGDDDSTLRAEAIREPAPAGGRDNAQHLRS